MTRACTVYEHDLLFRSPSDRIGSYRSPRALNLTKSVVKERITGSAFSSPNPPSKVRVAMLRMSALLAECCAPRSLTAVWVLQATALGQTAAEYYRSLNLEKPEPENAAIQFSRQRTHSLARDDTIRPFSKIEADSHQNFYDFLDNVEIAAIAPIKQEWIFNVCGMSRMDSFTAIPKVGMLPASGR